MSHDGETGTHFAQMWDFREYMKQIILEPNFMLRQTPLFNVLGSVQYKKNVFKRNLLDKKCS